MHLSERKPRSKLAHGTPPKIPNMEPWPGWAAITPAEEDVAAAMEDVRLGKQLLEEEAKQANQREDT